MVLGYLDVLQDVWDLVGGMGLRESCTDRMKEEFKICVSGRLLLCPVSWSMALAFEFGHCVGEGG